MIADKQPHLIEGAAKVTRALDDASGIGTAIDQITQQDQGGFGGPARGVVRLDLCQQLAKQVVAAVDVANRIDPLAMRHARRTRRIRRRLVGMVPALEKVQERHSAQI